MSKLSSPSGTANASPQDFPGPTPGPPTKDAKAYLWSRFLEHRKWLLLSFTSAVVATSLEVYTISRIKGFIDNTIVAKNWGNVLPFCVGFVALFFFGGIASYFHRIFLRLANERTVKRIRNELFEKLLVLSPAQSQNFTSGRAVNFIMSDVFVVGNGMQVAADLIQQPLMLVGLASYLFYLNWKLCLVCIVTLPALAFIGKSVGRSARRNQQRLQGRLELISNHIIESVRGLKLAHAFGQVPHLKDDFNHQVGDSYKHLMKLARLEEIVGPLTKWITSIVGALLFGMGAFLVIKGNLSTGSLVAFVTAAGGLQQPIRQLNQTNVKLQMVFAAAKRIHDFLIEPLDSLSADQASILMSASSSAQATKAIQPSPSAELELRSVSFRYAERGSGEGISPWAVQDISLKLKSGSKLALVGSSGAGKSTLSYLILRFLDPVQGGVFLQGKDARQWNLRDYRTHFSYVSQDVFLFNKSVRENMLFGRQGASDDQIWQALDRANIRNFFASLPGGLNTVLGEQAGVLSGGERQRLSIARAFLRDAPILILDEPTSQLDAENEKAVQKALTELMKTRSAIVIAHRLSTVREADEIAVLGGGKILELGSPKLLLEKSSGHFKTLWDTQQSS